VEHEPQEASTATVIHQGRGSDWRRSLHLGKMDLPTSSKAPADLSSPSANTRSKKQTKMTLPCWFDDALVLYS
jgi:hypothetical protein